MTHTWNINIVQCRVECIVDCSTVFTRRGVAGAVLHLRNWLIPLFISPFPPIYQNTINHKPLRLGTWNCTQCSTPVMCHVSRFTCHLSHVTCHISIFFLFQIVGAIQWRVCYQPGLPLLVIVMFILSYFCLARISFFINGIYDLKKKFILSL